MNIKKIYSFLFAATLFANVNVLATIIRKSLHPGGEILITVYQPVVEQIQKVEVVEQKQVAEIVWVISNKLKNYSAYRYLKNNDGLILKLAILTPQESKRLFNQWDTLYQSRISC